MTERILTSKNCPPCPGCGRLPWREGHLVQVQIDIDGADNDASITVCMHCSAVHFLCVKDRMLSWREPTKTEWEIMGDYIKDVQKRFAYLRGPQGRPS